MKRQRSLVIDDDYQPQQNIAANHQYHLSEELRDHKNQQTLRKRASGTTTRRLSLSSSRNNTINNTNIHNNNNNNHNNNEHHDSKNSQFDAVSKKRTRNHLANVESEIMWGLGSKNNNNNTIINNNNNNSTITTATTTTSLTKEQREAIIEQRNRQKLENDLRDGILFRSKPHRYVDPNANGGIDDQGKSKSVDAELNDTSSIATTPTTVSPSSSQQYQQHQEEMTNENKNVLLDEDAAVSNNNNNNNTQQNRIPSQQRNLRAPNNHRGSKNALGRQYNNNNNDDDDNLNTNSGGSSNSNSASDIGDEDQQLLAQPSTTTSNNNNNNNNNPIRRDLDNISELARQTFAYWTNGEEFLCGASLRNLAIHLNFPESNDHSFIVLLWALNRHTEQTKKNFIRFEESAWIAAHCSHSAVSIREVIDAEWNTKLEPKFTLRPNQDETFSQFTRFIFGTFLTQCHVLVSSGGVTNPARTPFMNVLLHHQTNNRQRENNNNNENNNNTNQNNDSSSTTSSNFIRVHSQVPVRTSVNHNSHNDDEQQQQQHQNQPGNVLIPSLPTISTVLEVPLSPEKKNGIFVIKSSSSSSQNGQTVSQDGAVSLSSSPVTTSTTPGAGATTLALPMRWLPTPWARHLLLIIGTRLSPCVFGLLYAYLKSSKQECDGINFDHWQVFFMIARNAEIERRKIEAELKRLHQEYLDYHLNEKNYNANFIDPLKSWLAVAQEAYMNTKSSLKDIMSPTTSSSSSSPSSSSFRNDNDCFNGNNTNMMNSCSSAAASCNSRYGNGMTTRRRPLSSHLQPGGMISKSSWSSFSTSNTADATNNNDDDDVDAAITARSSFNGNGNNNNNNTNNNNQEDSGEFIYGGVTRKNNNNDSSRRASSSMMHHQHQRQGQQQLSPEDEFVLSELENPERIQDPSLWATRIALRRAIGINITVNNVPITAASASSSSPNMNNNNNNNSMMSMNHNNNNGVTSSSSSSSLFMEQQRVSSSSLATMSPTPSFSVGGFSHWPTLIDDFVVWMNERQ